MGRDDRWDGGGGGGHYGGGGGPGNYGGGGYGGPPPPRRQPPRFNDVCRDFMNGKFQCINEIVASPPPSTRCT